MRRQPAGQRGQHRRLKVAALGVVRVKPVGPMVMRDHHGHAVVDLTDVVGRLGRDNRGRPQPGAFGISRQSLIPPELVNAGKGQRTTVLPVDVVRLLALFSLFRYCLPFVVAVGRENAAALGEGAPERGLDRHGLGPGVDELSAARGVLGPRRDQAPAHRAQLTSWLLVFVFLVAVFLVAFLVARASFHDRVYPPGRRHVVVRGRFRVGSVGDAVPLDAELLEELKALTRRYEATAHADFPSWHRFRHVPLSLDWRFITKIQLRQTRGPGRCQTRGWHLRMDTRDDTLRLCMLSPFPATRTGPGPRPPRPGRSAPGSGCPRPSPSPTGPWSWPPCPTGRPASRTRCGPGTPCSRRPRCARWGPRSRTPAAQPRRAGWSPPGSRPRVRRSASTWATPARSCGSCPRSRR